MPDSPEGPRGPRAPAPEPPPTYTKYRAAPRFLRRSPRPGEPFATPRDGMPGAVPADPGAPARRRGPRLPRIRGPLRPRRLLGWFVLCVLGWLALSLVLFLVSAQVRQADPTGNVDLGGAGWPLTSPNTILVLGSDQRTAGTKEPGASTSGPSRSDTILLLRVGGGKSARLSIPRDTVVDIPGHGRDKINAAYAYGGPALAVRTIQSFLGLKVNHLMEVNFENFPELIDAMGGVDYTGGCVISKINGGYANGGITLRLKRGTSHLNGKQALALARTRHNACAPRESDLTRARRQQKLLAAMKSRVLSVNGFLRLPWISWNAPKALRTDMSGPTLMGLFGALATGGTPATRVLTPTGTEVSPGGGAGLSVSAEEVRREVRRFLAG